jgi:hypothetical protein
VRIVAERRRPGADPTVPLQDWARITTGLLRRAEREGVLRVGVDPAGAAEVLVGAVLGQRYLAEQLPGEPLAARVRSAWALLLPSLASDSWLTGWAGRGWDDLLG